MDGHLLITSLDGAASIIAIDGEPRIVASHELSEPAYASPAVCADAFFIRGIQHLWCLTRPGR
jgi:hypothetical protein